MCAAITLKSGKQLPEVGGSSTSNEQEGNEGPEQESLEVDKNDNPLLSFVEDEDDEPQEVENRKRGVESPRRVQEPELKKKKEKGRIPTE
ncbi:hypothetical protein [Candidatus Burkholderia verschuerenii]|uniref:hypothetical protein n=1 Tax=Candidatus Burkholderia verschuerenii TaxID=242163 RepID=UPI0012ECBDAF|nr:hypothetical protein [Candidatus Burkholderia verschuerenii]